MRRYVTQPKCHEEIVSHPYPRQETYKDDRFVPVKRTLRAGSRVVPISLVAVVDVHAVCRRNVSKTCDSTGNLHKYIYTVYIYIRTIIKRPRWCNCCSNAVRSWFPLIESERETFTPRYEPLRPQSISSWKPSAVLLDYMSPADDRTIGLRTELLDRNVKWTLPKSRNPFV
jgi:hypothetical protein